ncbi:MAG: S1-like domain-containing RNA-binding protein [Lachnospiraceae bacterium]|nr:S1-like domain-containing RNA-binding protein [Lachnospiraceae bacterium]
MIELGKVQTLYMVKGTDHGIYLNDAPGKKDGSILLPKKMVPDQMRMADAIEVFVYKDSEDRPIATTTTPKLVLGEVAKLRCLSLSSIGAFMDWGLEKDLFLPFKEQTMTVREGKEYLCTLYIDKSERLCASMRVYDLLSTDSPYKVDDHVKGTITSINEELGVFVAVDNKYNGMIPMKEVHKKFYAGDEINARVARVRPDGKLDLSLREKAYIQMDADCILVMDTIDSYDGVLPFTDKAAPAVIKRELGISKNAFKRAVGRLLKQGKIEITQTSIRRI